jgi:hypothetical protein
MATNRRQEPNRDIGKLWAWLVNFVVTLGLHVGIVLFAGLSAALSIYALAGHWGGVTMTQLGLLGLLIVVSLTIWGVLIKHQVRGFRPHTIRGLGNVDVVATGTESGELGADICAGLIGLAQALFWMATAIERKSIAPSIPALVIAALFVLVGFGSFGVRLWLRRHSGC